MNSLANDIAKKEAQLRGAKSFSAFPGGRTSGNRMAIVGLQHQLDQLKEQQNDPLRKIQDQQLGIAKDFRAGLEGRKSSAAQGLQSQANQYMYNNLDQNNQGMNRRGLLYSGINAGNQGAIRADAAGKLNKAISTSNAGLDSMADQLDSDAISTSVAIQNSQQQIQNMLFSQAQAQLAGQNAVVGSAMGYGLLAGML